MVVSGRVWQITEIFLNQELSENVWFVYSEISYSGEHSVVVAQMTERASELEGEFFI